MIPEIATAVQTASTLISLSKQAKKIADSLKEAELKAVLAEIIGAAADVKLKLADANEELVRLKQRNAELEAFEDVSDIIEITSNKTILKEAYGSFQAGTLLCPACYSAKKLIPIQELGGCKVTCPACSAIYW